jgi:hypothetical protein
VHGRTAARAGAFRAARGAGGSAIPTGRPEPLRPAVPEPPTAHTRPHARASLPRAARAVIFPFKLAAALWAVIARRGRGAGADSWC